MSQFNLTIEVGGSSVPALQVDPGESVSVPIVYKNADGTARSMAGATVKCELRQATDDRVIYSQNLSDVNTLAFTPATTAAWPAKMLLKGKLTETSQSGAFVGNMRFQIQMGGV